jgi:TPR repeat protein
MGNSIKSAQFLIESRLSSAAGGSPEACFDLGVAYSCGIGGVEIDLVEAHKWFNLAALGGSEAGQAQRAEIAEEMTAREIAEAQRQARAWIVATQVRAA